MSIIGSILLGLASQAAPAAVDVAHDQLVAGRDDAAIARINANGALDREDPARLINLGVAHARQGDVATARAMFAAAARAGEAVYLETAEGDWVEARRLASRALAMLDRGEFAGSSRMASR